MTEEYFTRKDIALRMQVDVRTVDSWIEKKKLKAIKIGKLVRITKSSFDALSQDVIS